MIASLVVFTGVVFADAPTDPTTNPAGALQQFWDAIAAKRWGLAAVVGVMLFVALARFVAPRIHGKFGAWINSTRVSAVLALLSGGGAAMATQLMKGGAFSVQLVVYGFGFGVMAIGGYNAFFDILFPADKKQPPKMAIPAPPPLPPAAALLPLIFIAFSVASCAPCTTVDNATCARKVVNGVDALDGFVARQAAAWEKRCREGADQLAAAGKTEDARAAYGKCLQTGGLAATAVKETQNGAQAASDGIDMYEAANNKNYADLMVPLRSAVETLYKAIGDTGVVKLPPIDIIFGGK